MSSVHQFCLKFQTSLAKLACVLAIVGSASVSANEISAVQKLLATGHPEVALVKINQLLLETPRDVTVRFLSGLALHQLGRLDEAFDAFKSLTEDYPDLPEPFNNLAVIYAQRGEYDKARTTLEIAIRTNPGYIAAYENLGDIYTRLAAQTYAKAAQMDKHSAAAAKLTYIQQPWVATPIPNSLGTTNIAPTVVVTPTTSMPPATK